MAEVILDPAATTRAARDLTAVGAALSAHRLPVVSGAGPWGEDEAGAAFERVYAPAAEAALAAWSAAAITLERLGSDVAMAAMSTMDADHSSSTRFGRPS